MSADVWHRVTVDDPEGRSGHCSVCGPIEKLRRRARRGTIEWSCPRKHASYARRASPVKTHRSRVHWCCLECGFIAIHRAQLDVHHFSGDHSDNSIGNLITLCANCHRLYHALGRDGLLAAQEHRKGCGGAGPLSPMATLLQPVPEGAAA